MSGFRVLGAVEAWTDEQRLVLGGRQQVVLLAFLLLHANRAVSADEVTDAVWGSKRDGASNRLNMGVFRLRKALAPLDGEERRGCAPSEAVPAGRRFGRAGRRGVCRASAGRPPRARGRRPEACERAIG